MRTFPNLFYVMEASIKTLGAELGTVQELPIMLHALLTPVIFFCRWVSCVLLLTERCRKQKKMLGNVVQIIHINIRPMASAIMQPM